MAVPETTESTASTAVDETNDGFGAALAPETPEVEVTVSSPCDASGGGYKQDGKGDGGGEAAAEVERLAKAIAGLRTADSMENLASLVPADTSGPDIFDRLGYGDSASEDEADGDAEGASRETDGASSSSSASSDEDDDDTVAPFAHAVRAVVSGVEPLDPAALGVLARALAVDLASTLADRDGPFESLEDAPRVISAAVDALPELALALTLAPPDAITQRGGTTTPAAGSHRVAVVEAFAALLSAGIPEVDRAVASRRVAAADPAEKKPEDAEEDAVEDTEEDAEGGAEGGAESPDTVPSLTPVTASAAMLFTHERGTPLHCAVARLLCAALSSPEESAWAPLLDGGWGPAAAAVGVTPPPTDERAEGSLQARLAGVAEAAVDQKPGERACNLAMALVVAGTLRDLEGDEDPPHLLLREKLEADAAWQAFVGEEGAMAKFDAEQSGGLCGPKPSRGITVNEFAGFGGGYAGRNLLEMLTSLGARAGTTPAHGS